MGDDHPCNVEGIGTVRVKMFDGSEVCISTQNESYLYWCFENVRSCGIYTDGILKMTKAQWWL